MATSINETEIKYEMPSGVELPKLDELRSIASVRTAADEDLDAQYFDTDDLRLIHAGVTLRRRVGGHDEGWHLKTPVGLHTRRELWWLWDHDEHATDLVQTGTNGASRTAD